MLSTYYILGIIKSMSSGFSHESQSQLRCLSVGTLDKVIYIYRAYKHIKDVSLFRRYAHFHVDVFLNIGR